MRRLFVKFYKGFLIIFSLPIILSGYFGRETGKEYNVGFFSKLFLLFKMIRNNIKITSASGFLEHLIMATVILKIPKIIEGCIIECGSYKGGSTANLSLICALCNRPLEVFDSFEGLPEPLERDKEHLVINTKEIHSYSKGAWSGTLKEVKENISRYGKINLCHFHVGYFKETLPNFKQKSAFIFLDIDLKDSLETCLKYLWPLLQDGCALFTHEVSHIKMAALFFDKEWWIKNMNFEPPGLIGAGSGLGLYPASNGFKSSLGYTIKNPNILEFKKVPQTGI